MDRTRGLVCVCRGCCYRLLNKREATNREPIKRPAATTAGLMAFRALGRPTWRWSADGPCPGWAKASEGESARRLRKKVLSFISARECEGVGLGASGMVFGWRGFFTRLPGVARFRGPRSRVEEAGRWGRRELEGPVFWGGRLAYPSKTRGLFSRNSTHPLMRCLALAACGF